MATFSGTKMDACSPKEPYIVKKSQPVLVPPAKKTPDGNYFLSNIDQNGNFLVNLLLSFKGDESRRNNNIIHLLKDALAKVLVEFYPYTGRVSKDSNGRFVVNFDGRGGVPFVEAYVDDRIEVIGDITVVNPARLNLLHFSGEEIPLTVQVTRFRCGGFTIGIVHNHIVGDGESTGMFMNCWSETTRGIKLTHPPFLDRTFIQPRQPPKIEFSHQELVEEGENIEITESDEMVYGSFCFHPEMLTRLRSIACADPSIKPPTNFELITALTWRLRTKALKVNPDKRVYLGITVNLRQKLNGFLPKGYFGNGIYFPCCYCKAGELLQKPLSFAVKLVQENLASVTESYVQSYIDGFEVKRKVLRLNDTWYITKLTRLPVYDADFGWGTPTQVMFQKYNDSDAFYHRHRKGSENVVLSLPLPASAMKIFQELIWSELLGRRAAL